MAKRITTEEWIKKAKEIHKNKYDYSKVVYKDAKSKICIICLEHGEFWQSSSAHLSGQGCPTCANIIRGKTFKLSNEDFINRMQQKYGDEYDYTETVYENSSSIIKVKCKKHGVFSIKASHHATGVGCPQCSKEKKKYKQHKLKTTEQFIEELKQLFGDRIDYSEINYVNAKTPVIITDKELDYRYTITPTKLLTRGLKQRKKYTQELFVTESKNIHGDKYDYTNVSFEGMNTKVCIICPKHGEFWQEPSNHLLGYGCSKCGIDSAVEKSKMGKAEFVKKANAIHHGTYSYENFIYVNYKTKSYITCLQHGDFLQSPSKHLIGHGCPLCGESNLEKEIRLYLEANEIPYIKEYSPEWLKKGKGKQRIDFLITGTKYAIECQGIQHFITPNFKYKTDLNQIIERDERKNNLASEYGYKILYYTTEENYKYKNVSKIYENNLYYNINELFSFIFNKKTNVI